MWKTCAKRRCRWEFACCPISERALSWMTDDWKAVDPQGGKSQPTVGVNISRAELQRFAARESIQVMS